MGNSRYCIARVIQFSSVVNMDERYHVSELESFEFLGDVQFVCCVSRPYRVVVCEFGSEGGWERLIVYDNRFNSNEWFVIAGLSIGILLVILLPRRFPIKTSIVFFMCGVFFGFFFDHTLSVIPVSFYDVNDSSRFQLIDFISYFMYGPVSYLFFYVYDRLRIKPTFGPLYILCWSLIAVGMEWMAVAFRVFHYQNGYRLAYSFPIYLVVQSIWVILYYRIKRVPH